jgi:hypothetical protein
LYRELKTKAEERLAVPLSPAIATAVLVSDTMKPSSTA